MNRLPYNIGPQNVTVYVNGDAMTVPRSPEILDAIRAADWELVATLAAPVKAIAKAMGDFASFGDVTVTPRAVKFKGREVNNASTARILALAADGLPVESEVRFLASLMRHDDPRVIASLEDFMDRWQVPRLADGRILLCKGVTADFKSTHSGPNGPVDWTPGKTVPRLSWDYVDRDPDRTCSSGYHAAPLTGAQSYCGGNGHLLEVALWPEDIAALPTDYISTGKLRAVYLESLRVIPPAVASKYYSLRDHRDASADDGGWGDEYRDDEGEEEEGEE